MRDRCLVQSGLCSDIQWGQDRNWTKEVKGGTMCLMSMGWSGYVPALVASQPY